MEEGTDGRIRLVPGSRRCAALALPSAGPCYRWRTSSPRRFGSSRSAASSWPASRQGNIAAKLAPVLDSGWRPESVVVVAVVGEYPKLGVKVSVSPDPFASAP